MKNKLKLINNKGSLLIEVLIGLVLSSFLLLVIMSVYSNFDDEKRVIVQSNRILTEANNGLYPIKMDAMMAGWGFPIREELGCDVIGYNVYSDNSIKDINFNLFPVKITSNGSNFDEVTFISGRTNFSLDRLSLTSAVNKASTLINVGNIPNLLYYNTNTSLPYFEDAIFFESNKKCTLASIAIDQNSTGAIKRETAYATSLKNYYPYNKLNGLVDSPSYSIGSFIYLLGNLRVNKYFVSNGKLKYKNLLNNNEQIIMNNVMLFKIKYGIDSNLDGKIDAWSNVFTDYSNIKALKIGLLVRSPIKEKKKDNNCIITKNDTISFQDDNYTISELTGDPDWACFRYRFIKEEIELRNLKWAPKLN